MEENQFDLEDYLFFDDCYFKCHIEFMLNQLEAMTDQEPENIKRNKQQIKDLVKALKYALIEEA